MEQISIYLSAGILGIMLFFSFVIAPVIFKSLDEKNAELRIGSSDFVTPASEMTGHSSGISPI